MNDAEINNFYLGPIAAFNEGGIEAHSRLFCVRQYNKDKPEKLRIDFFVIADSTHYFISHIYVYQVNNSGIINIKARVANIPTTIK